MSTLNKKHREKYAEHARKNYKHLKMRTEPSDGKGWFKRRDIQFNHLPLPQVDKIKWLKETVRHSEKCIYCKSNKLEIINWASVVENAEPDVFIDTNLVTHYLQKDEPDYFSDDPMISGRCYLCKDCMGIMYSPHNKVVYDGYDIWKSIQYVKNEDAIDIW